VLALPEDMLTARADVPDPPRVEAVPIAPARGDMARVHDLLAAARSPLCIVGGRRWDDHAVGALRRFAESTGMPVACGFRQQDLFDNRHAQYAGDVGIGINPKLAARVRAADVLLVIGERLGEMTTSGYTLLDVPVPVQGLVHVHAGVEELGRVYQPAVGVVATPGEFLPRSSPL
jgi:acetolactate synthase-1/2/3 large subunit